MMLNVIFAAALSFLPYFEARNNLALRSIMPEAANELKESDCKPILPDMTKLVKCMSCKGNGVLVLKEEDFGQLTGRIRSARKIKQKCPICGGKGKRMLFIAQEELKAAIAKDYAKYCEKHSKRGEIAFGAYFLPKDCNADKKTIRRVIDQTGKVCRKCEWSGIDTCRKCKGEGLLRCSDKNCHYGWSVKEESGDAERDSSDSVVAHKSGSGKKPDYLRKISVEICEECHGSCFVICENCSGRGAVACKSCRGVGYKIK